jgi:hypothetical protein
MCRAMSVIVAGLAGTLLVLASASAQSAGIKVEKEFKGTLKDKKPYPQGAGGEVFCAEVSVELKAGQSIRIVVKVVGEGRRVALRLLDPTGIVIGDTRKGQFPPAWPKKTAQYTHEEVPDSGKYKIEISSDLAGPFRQGERTSNSLSEHELRKQCCVSRASKPMARWQL